MAKKKETSRYSPEFRECAVRLLDEHCSDYRPPAEAERTFHVAQSRLDIAA